MPVFALVMQLPLSCRGRTPKLQTKTWHLLHSGHHVWCIVCCDGDREIPTWSRLFDISFQDSFLQQQFQIFSTLTFIHYPGLQDKVFQLPVTCDDMICNCHIVLSCPGGPAINVNAIIASSSSWFITASLASPYNDGITLCLMCDREGTWYLGSNFSRKYGMQYFRQCCMAVSQMLWTLRVAVL